MKKCSASTPPPRRAASSWLPAGEEKTEFDLVIDAVDADKRIAIIKVVRGLTELGLKEAKDAVTNVPFTILAGKTKGEVEEAKKALEEGGAKCSIK